MKKKLKFGFLSQGYEAPRAESIEMSNQGMLCASPAEPNIDGNLEGFTYDGEGSWGHNG